MKKYSTHITIGLLWLLSALCWLFFYQGHLYYWHSTSTAPYLINLDQQAGLTFWIRNLIYLLFKYPVVAALLQALPTAVVACLTLRLVKQLGYSYTWYPVSLLSAGLLVWLQLYRIYFISDSLFALWVYIGTIAAVTLRNTRWRYLYYLLSYPLCVWLLPTGYLLVLYATFALVECTTALKPLRILTAVGLLLLWRLTAPLWLWLREEQVGIAAFPKVYVFEHDTLILSLLLAIPALLILVRGFKRKVTPAKPPQWKWIVTVSLGIGATLYNLYPDAAYGDFERLLRIDKACEEGNWDEVKQLNGIQKKRVNNLFCYTTLALTAQHQLQDSLFSYPITPNGPLFAPEGISNLYTPSYIYLYRLLNLPQIAIQQTMELSTIRPNGRDVKVLKLLAELNIEAGEYPLAEKYLNVLEHTGVYDAFVEQQRKRIIEARTTDRYPIINVQSSAENLFFEIPSPFPVMLSFLPHYKDKSTILDCLLTSLLATRNYQPFCEVILANRLCDAQDTLPKAYAEALALAPLSEIQLDRSDFYIAPEVNERLRQFLEIHTNPSLSPQEKTQRLYPFGDTWWYYALYVQ